MVLNVVIFQLSGSEWKPFWKLSNIPRVFSRFPVLQFSVNSGREKCWSRMDQMERTEGVGKFRILNLGLEIPIVFSFFLFVLEFLRRREKFQNRCDK